MHSTPCRTQAPVRLDESYSQAVQVAVCCFRMDNEAHKSEPPVLALELVTLPSGRNRAVSAGGLHAQ
jgi:hypothetical protein